jgi:tyrosinase
MQARLFDNPVGWKFQAAMHGYDVNLYPPLRPGENLPSQAIQTGYWDQCQHASWFFLPWHRIYVFLFEQMCRDAIVAKGGPLDWALPYWDYSHPKSAQERTLPTDFRSATLAVGGNNPLYTGRGPGVNSGAVVGTDQQSENTSCMKSNVFSGTVPSGFGGGISTPMQFSKYTGSCENGPHNSMHDAIGGTTGWMDNPMTAALDPIFWLHHANIDRLWVIWQADPSHAFPPNPQWNNETFDFFDASGAPKSYPVKDVLQTTGPLCDYVYENTTNPLGIRPVVPPGAPGPGIPPSGPSGPVDALAMRAMNKSQLIGATSEPSVTLGSGERSVSFKIQATLPVAAVGKRTLKSTDSAVEPIQVHLALENIRAAERPIHTYEVYVNVPEGEAAKAHPELMAGLIPRFGLIEASRPGREHGGQGLNLSFDITGIVSALRDKGAWDSNNVHVTFAPHDVQEDERLRLEGKAVPQRQPVTVGRVGIYTQWGT